LSSSLQISFFANVIILNFLHIETMQTHSLPTPDALKASHPLSERGRQFIAGSREAAKKIVSGEDRRKALIVGPCSIHDPISALEYAERLKTLSQAVEETCFLVMRTYMEKPRTTTGWKGFLYDPHLNRTHAISTGLRWTRELLLKLAEMHVPCATEFVHPLASPYFDDLITWGFIGARTCSSQPHRQFASLVDFPIGFKNSVEGNIYRAIHGVLAAKEEHCSFHIDGEGKLCAVHSRGNPNSHIVLRGSCDGINYDPPSIRETLSSLEAAHLPQRIMIDCAHGNSRKQGEKQEEVFLSVLEQIEAGRDEIFGWMLESHLEGGSQPLSQDPSQFQYAVSITDPCLDWATTERLIYSADVALSASGVV
jgi:3-deoxy-7-phosphoheptulonate synthase